VFEVGITTVIFNMRVIRLILETARGAARLRFFFSLAMALLFWGAPFHAAAQGFSGRWELESPTDGRQVLTLTQSGERVSGTLETEGTRVDLEGSVDRGFLRGWATGFPGQGRLLLWAEFAHDGLMVNLVPLGPDDSLHIEEAIQFYFLRKVPESGEGVKDALDVVILL